VFCANGKLAASGGSDGSVRIWDLHTLLKANGGDPKPAAEWTVFYGKVGISDLSLTPDGATLIAASVKGEIRIADVQKKETIKSFKGHDGRIQACISSPNGKV